MGVDFIQKRQDACKKHVDRNRERLSTSDLLTATPDEKPRLYKARAIGGYKCIGGEELIVEKHGESYFGCVENRKVVKFESLPAEAVVAIEQSSEIACGRIEIINPISQTLEVSVS